MSLYCVYCGHGLATFVAARIVVEKREKTVACADLDACRVRRDERERRARNAEGYINPVGGSWAVHLGAEVIAMRPDKASALECLLQALDAAKGAA